MKDGSDETVCSHVAQHRAAVLLLVWLAASLVAGINRDGLAQQPATAAGNSQSASPSGIVLAMPYGQHTDDLDGMVKRKTIRALVLINPIGFSYVDGQPEGVMYEALRDFETFVNQKLKTGPVKIEVTFIPERADRLEAALKDGVGDLIAYALVVTPERQQQVAFTVPLEKDVKQVVVGGPNFGAASSLEDLGGKQIYVNPLSVNYANLRGINERLQKAGKPAIAIKAADKTLLDDDLLQMVNAGLIPATVSAESKAKLWAQVLPHLSVRSDLVVASGEQWAWAVRKNNPQLKQLLNEYLAARSVGTSFGNTLLRRYLQDSQWVQDATSPEQMKKFAELSELFKKYATPYDFDYLLVMAQGYQESQLEQNRRSPYGAVGIMQVNPRDAAAPPIDVPNVTTAPDNILAGVKMMRNIEDKYLNDPSIDPLNKTLLAFASYNAGPNRIAELRRRAHQEGLDPNKWFDNVELIVARDIGQVTVTYVGNIYKYYVAYQLALGQNQ